MEQKQERVLFETSRHRIWGTVTLARDGYRSRISDMLNASERSFISLTDVTVQLLDGSEPPVAHQYMALARDHVVYAVALPSD
jgi:hypothetical protein